MRRARSTVTWTCSARSTNHPPGCAVDGYLVLLGSDDHSSPGLAQNFMLSSVLPQIYERWWRPALGRVAKGAFGPGMNEEKRIARLLLALSPGDGVLDVG